MASSLCSLHSRSCSVIRLEWRVEAHRAWVSRLKATRRIIYKSACKIAGRLLAFLAFRTQCIRATVLCAHGRMHNVVTHVNQRIFQLACCGLLLGILTLGVIARLPVFHRPFPSIPRSRFEASIIWQRSCAPLLPHGVSPILEGVLARKRNFSRSHR